MDRGLAGAFGGAFGPFVALQGLPYFLHGQHREGWKRLTVGLLVLCIVAAFYGGIFGSPVGIIIGNPWPVFIVGLLLVVTYIVLWIQGLVYASRFLRQ